MSDPTPFPPPGARLPPPRSALPETPPPPPLPAVRFTAEMPTTPPIGTGFAGTLQGLLWGFAGLGALGAGLAAASRAAFDDFRSGDDPGDLSARQADWLDLDDTLVNVSQLFGYVWLAMFVLLLIWMFKAHRVSEVVRPNGARRWSTGWTIAGWFVPIANLIVPRLVLAEMELTAEVAADEQLDRRSGRRVSVWAHGWVWWYSFAVAFVVWFVDRVALSGAARDISPAEVRATYAVRIVAFIAFALAGVTGAFYVRRMTKSLNAAAAKH